ncbi:MAG: PhzF family phenazine biosynthesis protein [Spirochaetia bacterium]|nr:PhzF family phenazine biosynthesis protein [Spirochaetia bacterium]
MHSDKHKNRQFEFYTCDVFTNERFGGNQLAVLPNAENLDGTTMQKISREFNYSETTFVTKSDKSACDFKVRIFTPAEELPFAGHPTLGTAFILAISQMVKDENHIGETTFETGIGPVKVQVHYENKKPVFMRFNINTFATPEKTSLSKYEIASAINLQKDDIGAFNLTPVKINFGAVMLMVPLKNIAALEKANINWQVWNGIISSQNIKVVYLFTQNNKDEKREYSSRMFAPELGVNEDPATGAAAAALGMFLARFDKDICYLAHGNFEFTIYQGIQMGRPSRLEVSITKENGKLSSIDVGGGAVLVSKGMFLLD